MNTSSVEPVAARREPWTDACGAAATLSLFLIVCHIAGPSSAGVSMPYSGGGAVVLGIGATLCLALRANSARIASAIGLVSLMTLRALSPLTPGLLVAKHGSLTLVDAVGLVSLLAAAIMLAFAATRHRHSGPDMTQQPSDTAIGVG